MSSLLTVVVDQIRSERGLGREVPDFDPKNGNELAKFLFVLEAPGPQAIATGFISYDNPDRTAANLRSQLSEAGIDRGQIALWNIVPWYLGNDAKTKIRAAQSTDISLGSVYLAKVAESIPTLKCIVLVGGAARQAHIHLSSKTNVRILSCHHPSPKIQNTNSAAKDENIAIFRFMLASSQEG